MRHQAAISLERAKEGAPTEKRYQTAMSSKLAERCSVHSPTRSHTLSPYSDIRDGVKHRGSRTKLSSPGKEKLTKPILDERSLILDILSDTRRLSMLVYLLWLVSTWTWASYNMIVIDKMEPVCLTPWLGQGLSRCHHLLSLNRVDVAKLPSSRQHLEGMMDYANQNFGLAERMLSKAYHAKDLEVRLNFSELKCKVGLGSQLEKTISLSRKIAG